MAAKPLADLAKISDTETPMIVGYLQSSPVAMGMSSWSLDEGKNGGQLMFAGRPAEIANNPTSSAVLSEPPTARIRKLCVSIPPGTEMDNSGVMQFWLSACWHIAAKLGRVNRNACPSREIARIGQVILPKLTDIPGRNGPIVLPPLSVPSCISFEYDGIVHSPFDTMVTFLLLRNTVDASAPSAGLRKAFPRKA
jgi:hypothetical protein